VRGLGWRLQLPIAPEQKIPLLLSLYALAPLLLWCFGRYGDPGLADFGLAWQPHFFQQIALGFALGLGGIGLLLGLKQRLGWISWRRASLEAVSEPVGAEIGQASGEPLAGQRLLSVGLPIALLALVISGIEEAIFRGFVVNQLTHGWGWVGGVAIASAIFALLHLVWDGPAGLPQQPGLWLMGTVLVVARWADGGQLGLPIGLHAGWIFTLALVDTIHLVEPLPGSPRWIAGRADQPLTGLLDITLLLCTGIGLWGFRGFS
jgi:uncharacterized protein